MVYKIVISPASFKGSWPYLSEHPLTLQQQVLFETDLVSLEDLWKLPVMRLLSQVVKVAVGQLSAFGGNLHGETS